MDGCNLQFVEKCSILINLICNNLLHFRKWGILDRALGVTVNYNCVFISEEILLRNQAHLTDLLLVVLTSCILTYSSVYQK